MATLADSRLTGPVTEINAALPDTESEVSVLGVLALLASHKRVILRAVVGAALFSTIVAFLLPVRYEANIVMMPPQQNSSIGSTLGQLGTGGSIGSLIPLASLASGGLGIKNPADMYVALLTSRTVEDAMVQRFGLLAEYHEKRLSDARKELENRTNAVAGTKDGLIRISVEDRDPRRAAELANGYVEEFRKLSATLAITEAARRRLFFEQQLQEAKDNLSSAEEAMRATQQSTGVLQIDSQARSLIESAAILRGQVVAKQVQIQSMRSFAAEDNPRLVLAKQELAALQAQLDRLAGSKPDAGSDIILSKGRVTGSGIEYVRRLRDLKYHETVFELLAKQFEIAKLDEAREGSIIQVVDSAVAPDKRSSPHRLLIVISVTILAFFLTGFWIVLHHRWAQASDLPENRQKLQAIRDGWRGSPDRG
ncbi:MAG: chain length determinant family protein [Acidobacteria bacterium]|jgi:tyrosine-protein kinase Etk/Wzc|nr:MAG: chain length determinant family protein [Acidobacteriota bacterium]